eukprot:132182-Rhodomonas_salina.1
MIHNSKIETHQSNQGLHKQHHKQPDLLANEAREPERRGAVAVMSFGHRHERARPKLPRLRHTVSVVEMMRLVGWRDDRDQRDPALADSSVQQVRMPRIEAAMLGGL